MGHGDHLKVIDGGGSEKLEWGSREWADRLRKETKVLAKEYETGYMRLAEKLWLVFDTPKDGDRKQAAIFTTWGYGPHEFNKYVEVELGLHPKKAQRLMASWKAVQKLELDEDSRTRLIQLGSSKVRELIRVMTSGNAESWILKAKDMSYPKLCETIKMYLIEKETANETRKAEAAYNGSPGSTPTPKDEDEEDEDDEAEEDSAADRKRIEALEVSTKRVTFDLFGDQIETYNLALQRSMELSNSDKVGHNVSLICLDFLATNDFKFANEEQKIRFLAKYEKLLGVKLVIIDPEANEVVYGLKTLEKMARSDD